MPGYFSWENLCFVFAARLDFWLITGWNLGLCWKQWETIETAYQSLEILVCQTKRTKGLEVGDYTIISGKKGRIWAWFTGPSVDYWLLSRRRDHHYSTTRLIVPPRQKKSRLPAWWTNCVAQDYLQQHYLLTKHNQTPMTQVLQSFQLFTILRLRQTICRNASWELKISQD